jgi:hypothetical protein
MQLPNAPCDKKFPFVEAALQAERLQRYRPAAGNNPILAMQFYLWNCALCESFHVTLHFSEIVCRNALNRALIARGGSQWFENETLIKILDTRYSHELKEAVAEERRQHKNKMTCHHVVSALTFGFWEHLTTKRFERFLWAKGVQVAFPGAPKNLTYQDIQQKIESVRRWRNRIAHHHAVFDKRPTHKHQDALTLIGWVCSDTKEWVSSQSKVPIALSLRPK